MDTFEPTYQTQPYVQNVTLDFNTLVVKPLEGMLAQIVGFIPDLVAAVYILVFGWIIAQVLKLAVGGFFKAIRFDGIIEKTGLSDFFKEGDKNASASRWVCALIFWLTIFVSIVMALERLRLRIASQSLDQFLHLLFSAVTAVVILTVGMFLSELISRLVKAVAGKLNAPSAALHANIVRWAVLVFTLILTLAQFGIPGQFVLIGVGVVFLTLCVTFVIAFGTGGSAWAAKVLNKFNV
jgi:hypothetical protein